MSDSARSPAVAVSSITSPKITPTHHGCCSMNSARPNLFTVDLSARSELNKIQSQLAQLYGQERVRAAKRVSVSNRERGIAPLGRDRRGACTPAQASEKKTLPPGKAQPTLVQPIPRPEYPAYARRVGLSGSITLHLLISELGCIDRVEIAQSSGAPELDEAALDWAEQDLTVLPAEVDGKPVATVDDVHRLLVGMGADTPVRLSVLRGQQRIQIEVKVGEA